MRFQKAHLEVEYAVREVRARTGEASFHEARCPGKLSGSKQRVALKLTPVETRGGKGRLQELSRTSELCTRKCGITRKLRTVKAGACRKIADPQERGFFEAGIGTKPRFAESGEALELCTRKRAGRKLCLIKAGIVGECRTGKTRRTGKAGTFKLRRAREVEPGEIRVSSETRVREIRGGILEPCFCFVVLALAIPVDRPFACRRERLLPFPQAAPPAFPGAFALAPEGERTLAVHLFAPS